MRNFAVIGLGYAGLHTALAFGKRKKIIGYDIKKIRVEELAIYKDSHNEFTYEELKNSQVEFTSDPNRLKEADFYIVIVPTPINAAKEPDVQPLVMVSELIGKYLKPDDIVVYESTVYPGATEEVCLPILENTSG